MVILPYRLLSFLAFAAVAPSFACVNMVGRVPGVQQEAVEFYDIGSVEVDRDSLNAYINIQQNRCTSGPSVACNDLVIAYLFAKRFPQALELSTRLVAKFPRVYSVVITHASALELNGDPAGAIPFMKTALALNPDSHKGSEWIHLNLLEQSVRGEAAIDPWALIGVNLRPDSLPVAPDSLDLRKLAKQVHYQVNDRSYFTPKHDPLFGALLFAYADLLHLCGHKSRARDMYQLSSEYGYSYRMKVAALPASEPLARMQEAKPIIQEPEMAKTGRSDLGWLSWAFILAVALGVTVWLWRAASKG